MTDFTLGNDSSKIQEDFSSSTSRPINEVFPSPENFSTAKLNKNILDSTINEFDSTDIENNNVSSPENKSKKSLNDTLESKNVTTNNTSQHISTSAEFFKKEIRFGKTYPYCFYKGEPLIVIGPYYLYMFCLLCFFFIITACFFFTLWEKLTFQSVLFGMISYLIHTISYIYTSIRNPGIPSKSRYFAASFSTVGIKRYKICKICQIVMNLDIKTNHCNSCEICVEGFDHHCMWLTKCIGKNNLRTFYIFIISTWVLMGYFFYSLFTLN